MILHTFLTGITALGAGPEPARSLDILAIRVGRAETVSQGTIEHAVVLIEGSTIVAVGEDLPIERGIPILDRPDWVLTPGFVHCRTRIGLDGKGGAGSTAFAKASTELYATSDAWPEVLEAGYTTLGLYPDGTGIPGQAVAIRPHGDTAEEMIVADSVYLLARLASSAGSKKMLRDGFGEADEHLEKVQKEREKWEKAKEKAEKKKSKKKKDDDEDDDDKKKEDEKAEKVGPFVPPTPDEKAAPFLALRDKSLSALFDVRRASDYLHLLDVIEEEDIEWSLFAPARGNSDFDEITERVGERGLRIVLASNLTLRTFTRRERNLPAEFVSAGARVALVPSSPDLQTAKDWRLEVGRLVAAGLDRQTAIAAMTQIPAEVLGLEERLGSIEPGKDANLLLWDGDPFEPATRLQAVLLEGEIVKGDIRQ